MSLPTASAYSLQGRGMTSGRTRTRLIQRIRQQGVQDPAILERIGQVPRHLFVDEAMASRAYENSALPIGNSQTISQPYIVARMTEALLAAGPIEQVLEIGTGSGYQTAVLAPLVRRIYTIERIGTLLRQARQRFQQLRLKNIRTYHGDGTQGWSDYAPFDGILLTAAPANVPTTLLTQLRTGGRMILPVGPPEQQTLTCLTRTEEGYDEKILEPVRFVPMLTGISQ
ncbi:MAG: protein-L-isoaspartate(D-aspartate) O-methyltransferase [Pseudomonadota bacterium]